MKNFLLIITLLAFAGCSGNRTKKSVTEKIPVIFDTDANNELDDQHALAYLLMNKDFFEVRGITVNATRGGGNVDEQAAEAERVMRLCDRFDCIPLLKGANGSFPTILPYLDSANFDGAAAVNFIIREAASHSPDHKLTVILVGKLTNMALAAKKDSSILDRIKIVWLGSNYPDPGEYNLENDTAAMNYLLSLPVEFEMVTVRYGKDNGTAAVTVTPEEIHQQMPGKGPKVNESVTGRHGNSFNCFGDYSVDLFDHADLYGNPPSRALFDMAAVAVVKNPAWSLVRTIPTPVYMDNKWVERPANKMQILIRENFNRNAIVDDFFSVMSHYQLVDCDAGESE